ncbi:MAG: hypothetical protein J5518_01905 [Lachnospiraceae bacterium]|nr:hypothetical protein [Lachnospiraceae bacterium]
MMKKVLGKISILLVFCLIIGLVGCGSDEGEPANTAEAEAETEEEYEAEEEAWSDPEETDGGNSDGVEFNGHSYKYIDTAVSWTEAHDLCNSLGGHLVSINSPEEQEFIENEFNGLMVWIGAYNNGAYGGDKNDWRWVTDEEWSYTNFADGEPSNSSGEEWFGCIWTDMKWNDLREGDPGSRLSGFICEFDDRPDVFEGGEIVAAAPEEVAKEEKSQEEDPYFKDVGKGRYRIMSKERGVYIEYPYDYYANVEGDDALLAFDGDGAYVIARNITTEAMDYQGDTKAFCKAKIEEQLQSDFKMLFGNSTGMDNVKRKSGGGDLVCEVRANIWNGKYDMNCQSAVRTSKGDNGTYLILTTCFWKYNNKTSAQHSTEYITGACGIGTMYQ